VNAVEHASAKALIFAAARNSGQNQGRAWPARQRGVFAVHSVDNGGTWSRFNAPEMKESPNLAVVGESVRSYWPLDLCKVSTISEVQENNKKIVKSGTSYATPIAASLVAFILMFAQKHMDAGSALKLKEFRFMKVVIEGICTACVVEEHKPLSFNYLRFSRNPDNLFGKGKDDIVQVISNAIENEIKRLKDEELSIEERKMRLRMSPRG
jgi:hypothetical protein